MNKTLTQELARLHDVLAAQYSTLSSSEIDDLIANILAHTAERLKQGEQLAFVRQQNDGKTELSVLDFELLTKPQVYLSYTMRDIEIAKMIAIRLREDGFEPWLAHEQIRPGDRWVDKIVDGIKKSQWVLLLLSENTSSSEWIEQEIDYVFQLESQLGRRLLLPVLISGNEIPAIVNDLVYADFRNGNDFEFDRLVQIMKERQLPLNE